MWSFWGFFQWQSEAHSFSRNSCLFLTGISQKLWNEVKGTRLVILLINYKERSFHLTSARGIIRSESVSSWGRETRVQSEAPCCQNSVTLWHSRNLYELYFPNLCQRGWYLPCGFLEHRDQGRTHNNGPGAGQEPAQRQQSVGSGSSSSPCFPAISKSLCDGATWTRPGLVLGRLFALPALAGSHGGGVKTLQHLIMKAKSLFMFETT